MKTCQKICINCPAGCHLTVTVDDAGAVTVTGNRCPRGKAYAENEVRDPRRTVTAVVLADAPGRLCIPVRSTAPVPKAWIPELLRTLYAMRVKLPVREHQVLLANYRDSGIDIAATGSIL